MIKSGAKIPVIEDGKLTTEPNKVFSVDDSQSEPDIYERAGRKVLIVGELSVGRTTALQYMINKLGERNITVIDGSHMTHEMLEETMERIGNDGLIVFDDYAKFGRYDNVPLPTLKEIAQISAPYLPAIGSNIPSYSITQNKDFNQSSKAPRRKSEPREKTKLDLPDQPIKRIIPAGCKVWPEYGGVVANNEKNAKRKFENLKNKPSGE